MKRIPPELRHTFGSLKLYREDLDTIISMVTESGIEVTLSDNSYVYDSLDEMKTKAGAKVPSLKMNFRRKLAVSEKMMPSEKIDWSQPSGLLHLGRSRHGLMAGDYNSLDILSLEPEGERLFFRLREYLQPRERWMPKLFNGLGLWLLMFVALLVTSCLYFLRVPLPIFHTIFKLQYGFLGLYLTALIICRIIGPSHISLEYRSSQPSFWKKNRDEILKYVLFFALGSLLTWLFSYLRSHH